MPSITFMWHPRSDESLVGPIVDDLRAFASAHDISFHVNAKQEEDEDPVVVKNGLSVPNDAVERLRGLATVAGVTIYVNPA